MNAKGSGKLEVLELALLERLTAGFTRSPLALNAHQESDAELVRLPGCEGVLAVTTDGLAEEIETGLYDDAYRIGWMAVAVNASDLAAVGAEPVGILLAETLPADLDEGFLGRMQQGIADACAASGLPVLGGDTNFASRLQVGATALGWIPDGKPLTRIGCKPGERLYASGPLGGGSAFAFLQFQARAGKPARVPAFQPRPRLGEGQIVRRFATCAMDTSDGLLATLDQLARMNGVGMTLDEPLAHWLHTDAAGLAAATGLPAWMFLAGPHGEFELVFAVQPAREGDLLAAAKAAGWAPIALGSVAAAPEILVPRGDKLVPLDTAHVRNLFSAAGGDLDRYLEGLWQVDRQLASR